MDMPPLKLLVDPTVPPEAVHKLAQVSTHSTEEVRADLEEEDELPIHFTEEVKAGLEEDVKFDVIKRVPENTLVIWCSGMWGLLRRIVSCVKIN